MNSTTITLASLLEADPALAVVYKSLSHSLRPPPVENFSWQHIEPSRQRLCLTYFGGHQIYIHLMGGDPFAIENPQGHTWVRVGEFRPTWHRI